MNTVNIYLNLE